MPSVSISCSSDLPLTQSKGFVNVAYNETVADQLESRSKDLHRSQNTNEQIAAATQPCSPIGLAERRPKHNLLPKQATSEFVQPYLDICGAPNDTILFAPDVSWSVAPKEDNLQRLCDGPTWDVPGASTVCDPIINNNRETPTNVTRADRQVDECITTAARCEWR